MVFKAKNELEQYLTSINPIYAKYTEGLWANEVNSAAQLGNASVPAMHACGVENPVHAGDVIAQSKATGKWSCSCCSTTLVHYPARFVSNKVQFYCTVLSMFNSFSALSVA